MTTFCCACVVLYPKDVFVQRRKTISDGILVHGMAENCFERNGGYMSTSNDQGI